MPDAHHTKTKVLPGIRNRLQMNEHVSVSSIYPSRSVLSLHPPTIGLGKQMCIDY